MSVLDPVPVLHILLATYRGARFLPAQLDSLIEQRDREWRLLVSDDGSDDDTLSILRGYAARDPRIVMVERSPATLGATRNFALLLQHFLSTDGQWFALCDQDDVWLPHKVERLRRALRDHVNATEPCLAYSDLAWIDERGRLLSASHFSGAGLRHPAQAATVSALLHNLVPGCAMAGNRALAERALPLPTSVAHHDWWLLALAAAGGEVVPVSEVLVHYRQHGNNQVGASGALRRIARLLTRPAYLLAHAKTQYWGAVEQGSELRTRLGFDRIKPAWRGALTVSERRLAAHSRWRRVHAILSGAAKRQGLARSIFMLIGALQEPPPSTDRTGGCTHVSACTDMAEEWTARPCSGQADRGTDQQVG